MTATMPGTTVDPVPARLHRIDGQTRALVRMYEEGRPAADLLDLIAAVRAALGALGLALITQQVASRGPTAPLARAADQADVDEVLMLVRRLVRCT